MKAALGLPATVGGLLLAAGIAFHALALRPLEQRHALLLDQAQHAAKRSARAGRDLLPVSTAQGRLAAFYAFFRGPETITDHLAKLHGLALHAGVEGKVADYRLNEPRSLGLAEYTVAMPVTGSYTQIRSFLETALAQIPVLALEHVSMRRQEANEALVQADVRFTVFLVP
jgi:hypothetical protein